MDPLGFALEHFDGIGHWRDMDGTASIDATGPVPPAARSSTGPCRWWLV